MATPPPPLPPPSRIASLADNPCRPASQTGNAVAACCKVRGGGGGGAVAAAQPPVAGACAGAPGGCACGGSRGAPHLSKRAADVLLFSPFPVRTSLPTTAHLAFRVAQGCSGVHPPPSLPRP